MKTPHASRRVLPLLTAFSLFLLGTTAQAQQPAPAPTPPPAPPAAAPPAPVPPPSADVPPPQPPAEVPPPPVDVPPPATATMDEKMADAEAKIEGLNESLSATNATLSPLAKLKFSGYVQGQYEKHQESVSGLSATGAPTNLDRFSIRRGRLKATYSGENAEYLLQIDATGDAVVLKDAEATFVDTWTPLNFRITMGQFKVPFGYEILQSSADREMPERATVIRTLFPGERDRGVRVTAGYQQFKFMFAAVNGNFTQGDPLYGTRDQNRHVDLYGRVTGDFDFIVAGVSGEWGERLGSTVSPASLTITDTNMDGIIQANEIMRPAYTTRRFGLWRVGADAQFYVDVPAVGGLALKGEVIYSSDDARDFRGSAGNPCLSKTGLGYILTAVQNIGDHLGAVVRYDSWNPTTNDLDPGCMDPTGAMATTIANDSQNTLGGGLIGYISANLKFTAIYEWLQEQGTNKKDNNIFTARLQARF
jgi:hypothetical protein